LFSLVFFFLYKYDESAMLPVYNIVAVACYL